jgi:hypothetical protein
MTTHAFSILPPGTYDASADAEARGAGEDMRRGRHASGRRNAARETEARAEDIKEAGPVGRADRI